MTTGTPGGHPVEVVIACHSPERPLGRAVASVVEGNGGEAAVTVVCHNCAAEDLAAAVDSRHRDRVTFVEHHDGIPSPAGPFNAGIEGARAPFVSIMGSDDRLMPGAVASWLRLQAATGADAVVTRLALGRPANTVPTPVVRPFRSGRIDFVRDRLAYRSAPLGLFSTATIRRMGLRLLEGLRVGEDVAFTTRLYAEARVAYDRTGPAYVIGEDASDRVTYVLRPLRDQLAFAPPMLEDRWYGGLPLAARRSIAVKFLRIHVFGAVHYRQDPELWTEAEREDLREFTRLIVGSAPGCLEPLSLADRRLVEACLDPHRPPAELVAASQARRRFGRPDTLLVRSPRHLLDREAPLRFMAASAVMKWR